MKRKKRFPKGIRKYIRLEKARLRQRVLDLTEQKKQIEEIYKKIGLAKKQSKEYSQDNEER